MSFRLEFEHQGEVRDVSFDDDSITIGRDRNSDFVLDHPTVSRQHAVIVDEGGDDFRLVVLSRGGLTALDGRQVETEEVQLYDGAMIQLGQYSVRFRSPRAPSSPPGPSATAAGAAAGAGHQDAPEVEPGDGDDGDIQSWDEIAAGEDDEQADKTPDRGAARLKEARAGDDDEETNPLIVVVGLVGAVVMLGFAFLGGAGNGDPGADEQPDEVEEEEAPVVVEVDCHDETSCLREAETHYERGIDLIERRALDTGNLFEGYFRLVKARAHLEEAGIEEPPEEMADLEEQHDTVREELDDKFREFRVRFHQAQQRNRHEQMATVLEEVEEYFPERSAQENQWAREERRSMQRAGNYPPR